jgi:hypothetical protein
MCNLCLRTSVTHVSGLYTCQTATDFEAAYSGFREASC